MNRNPVIMRSSAAAGAVAGCAFVMYLITMCRGVTFIDSGELSTVAFTLGIAHPTGYPLFTLLGYLFSHVPVAAEPIVRLNAMAALFCAAGVFLFTLVFHRLLEHTDRGGKEGGAVRTHIRLASAAGAGLLLAFSETYWSQATSVEVYSLHLLLVSVVLLTFFTAALGDRSTGTPVRRWALFAFLLGLSFANHMTTILLAPGLLYLYFATQGSGRASWNRIGWMALPFVAGLSIYLYLPFRASQSPALDWGNPTTLERFLWHVGGKQYRVWIFSSTEAAGRQLQYFIDSLPAEFAYAGGILALAGLLYLLRKNSKILITTLLLFLTCLFYSINYDIHDIDSYFLLSYICVAFWAGCGLYQIGIWAGDVWMARGRAAVLVLAGLIPLFYHFGRQDERNNHLVEDYTMNMLSSFKPDALVLSYQWDFWVSASYYYQIVDGMRPDVVVVDKELLRRSWYIKQTGTRYPWLIQQSREEVDRFLREVDKFEHDRPYNAAVIEARYVEMISGFITKNLPLRPVYVTPEIEPEFTAGLQRAPEGLALRLYADTLFHPTARPAFVYRPFPRKGMEEDTIRRLYAEALAKRGQYYLSHDPLEAQNSFAMARTFMGR